MSTIIKTVVSGYVVGISALAISFIPFGGASFAASAILPFLVACILCFGILYGSAKLAWRIPATLVTASAFLVTAWFLNQWASQFTYNLSVALQLFIMVSLVAGVFSMCVGVIMWLSKSLAHYDLAAHQEA